MKAVKVNYEEKFREYEDLLDFRVLLKQEISIISSLFEEEETRYSTSCSQVFYWLNQKFYTFYSNMLYIFIVN